MVHRSLRLARPRNASIRLELIARADGRGPKESWGIVVTDCWAMDIIENPPAEPNLFVNGDFEQAGAVGSQDVGPGWKIGKTARVLTFGTVDEQAGSFGPYDGSKAIGLICHGVDKGGLLEQTATIEPGFYTLTLTGHLYLWDTFGGDPMNSHCEVWFNVDGKPVQYKRVYCTSPMGPNDSWGDLRWTWTGRVEHSADVSLNMQARGYGPEMSWGLVATDGWRLTADPTTIKDNLIINGDFEQAGEIGTKDAGPGWITDPKENMRVWGDIDVRTPMQEGHPASVHPNFAPRSGRKAMAVVAHAKDDSGTLDQTVKLAHR